MNEPTDNSNDAFEYWWNSRVKDDDSFYKAAWKAWHARGRYDANHPAPPNAWISVRDRLPEHTNNVIICAGGHVCVAHYRAPKWDVCSGMIVTHWQPYPAPPAPADPFDAWWESLPRATGYDPVIHMIGKYPSTRDFALECWQSMHATP